MKKRFFACDVDAENIYISSNEGMLFVGNKMTLKMSIVGCKVGKELLYNSPAERMAVCRRYIYLFGCDYKKVNVFDMFEKSCTVLHDYQNDPNMNRSIGGYFAVVKNEDTVYVFVDNQRGFYKIYNKHCIFIDFNAIIFKYNWSAENVLAYTDYDSCNAYFYFIDCGNVLCFESDKENWIEYDIQVIIESPVSIQKEGDDIYILTHNNSYYKCGLDDKCFNEVTLSDYLIDKDWDQFMITPEKGFLIPGDCDELVEIQMGQRGINTVYVDYPSDMKCILVDEYRSLFHKFREYCEDEMYRYYSERYYNYMMKINKRTGEISWATIVWPDDRSLIVERMDCGNVIREKDYDLQDWLLVVVNT